MREVFLFCFVLCCGFLKKSILDTDFCSDSSVKGEKKSFIVSPKHMCILLHICCPGRQGYCV